MKLLYSSKKTSCFIEAYTEKILLVKKDDSWFSDKAKDNFINKKNLDVLNALKPEDISIVYYFRRLAIEAEISSDKKIKIYLHPLDIHKSSVSIRQVNSKKKNVIIIIKKLLSVSQYLIDKNENSELYLYLITPLKEIDFYGKRIFTFSHPIFRELNNWSKRNNLNSERVKAYIYHKDDFMEIIRQNKDENFFHIFSPFEYISINDGRWGRNKLLHKIHARFNYLSRRILEELYG